MNKGRNILNKCIIFISCFILLQINVFAAESNIIPHFSNNTDSIAKHILSYYGENFFRQNSLSGIDVKQNDENNYKVLLKLDKKARIIKNFDKEGNLILILNSTLPSESMEIIYDNVNNLNNIIVQKKGDNNTLILLQGENIENTQIYIKELSTGIIKPLASNNSLLNSFFFVTDRKILVSSVLGIVILFLLMLASRPKEKRYTANNTNKSSKSNKYTAGNTLRNKNLMQSRNIPSINWNSNGGFSSVHSYMTRPEDFTVSKNQYENEKIRKAG